MVSIWLKRSGSTNCNRLEQLRADHHRHRAAVMNMMS